MAVTSAGLLIYRRSSGLLQVLLVHPGGPFWAKKDEAAWSIPKGLVEADEDELTAARRETEEELGMRIDGRFQVLGRYRQPGGKIVLAWCVEADVDAAAARSNNFLMEWPPRSGSMREFPEVDKVAWLSLPEAETKILKGQRPILKDFAERHNAG